VKFSEYRLCSNHISWRKIETVILDPLKELFLDPEYIFEKAIDTFFWNENTQDNKERYKELLHLLDEISTKMKRNEDAYIEWLITKESFVERKLTFTQKQEKTQKELDQEEEKFKSLLLKEQAKLNITQIATALRESLENFFDTASYDELKEFVSIVVDKVIVPKNKELPVKIIMKIPWRPLSFQERYYEEEFATFVDDNDREHIIESLWFIPKKLPLDPSMKPLKFRTVEFLDNTEESPTQHHSEAENKLLFFLKKKFYKLCEFDH